jgi:peptidoglycan/LPS O-acetylase OafA/YrhL
MQRITPFKTLDIFRGFAALWVVMAHSCNRWLADGNSGYLHVPIYAFSIRGQLGVMVFFVISGYCITAAAYGALITGKSVWRYGFERGRRIYPPYLAILILGILSLLVINYANAHHLIGPVHHLEILPRSWWYWIANIFLLQYEMNTPILNPVCWSLCYEVAFYFMIGLFLAGSKWVAAKKSAHAGVVFFVCAVGVSTMLTLVSMLIRGDALFPFDAWHQFSIGGVLFLLLELRPETISNYTAGFRRLVLANAVLVTVLTIAFAMYCQVGQLDMAHPSSRLRSLVCLGFAGLLIVLRPWDEQISSSRLLHPLMWIGGFSYSLYLMHPIVLPYVDILCRKAGLNGNRYWVAFWIQVAVGVVFGRMFYVLIERRFISKRQVQRLAVEHVA